MNDKMNRFGDSPPQSIVLILESDAGGNRKRDLAGWLEKALLRLNWRCHIYVLGQGEPGTIGIPEDIIQVVCAFLRQRKMGIVHLHPVSRLGAMDTAAKAEWGRFLKVARPFQKEAYQEQGEARLLILPIVALLPTTSADDALGAIEFFRNRLAKPSFFQKAEMLRTIMPEADDDIRFYIDSSDDSLTHGMVNALFVNHVFETVLDGTSDEATDLLAPCRRHWVVDEKSGGVFSCFDGWKKGEPTGWIHQGEGEGAGLPGDVSKGSCFDCIGRSVLAMRESLVVNNRNREGRQLYFKLGLAYSDKDDHRQGALMARQAFELSLNDEDRSAALIHEGLSYLSLGELEKAEDALQGAVDISPDPGLVAFHRGRVQFVWRDYIEALDRFEEVLKLGSKEVPYNDLYFQMALSHINIEEYADARPYLQKCRELGHEPAPVAFYFGVCDLNLQGAQKAMDHFKEALKVGPAKEDLSRVLFYLGDCLKTLERYDEAIVELKKAVEADPKDIANHNLLGFCYYKTKEHNEAVKCFLKAVEIDPRSGIDWANLGSNLRDLGKTKEAIAMYKKALTLDPTIAFARENLAALQKAQE